MCTNWQKRYQIIRSSDSIAANIAEGYGRYTPEYKGIKANVPISNFNVP
ncbi:MAG: four helix bundle protein [Thermodesulfobacteriota bacterium]|nr:four helix bundle protein [Thermodesulfobacteriota bacterium]